MSDSNPIIIVGGGLAGLAAAVELASRNIPVLVLEQREYCGGRAYSFRDKKTGDIIDNGQHVLIAGYEHTLRFLERIGTKHLLAIQDQPSLALHHPQRGMCEFRIPLLPSPLHLIAGILGTNLFSFADKLRVLRAGLLMHRHSYATSLDEMTIDEWLDSVGQTEETKRSFWEPLAVSIMNEHIASASARVFLSSLRHAFLGGWRNSALAIPTAGLSELYVDSAVAFLKRNGGEVITNSDITRLVIEAERVKRVRCKEGKEFSCGGVVLAVPHYRVTDILNDTVLRNSVSAIHSQPSTPIISIHLWFDIDFMPKDFIGLIDRRIQWIFNKRRLFRQQRSDGHLSCVISGADRFIEMTNDELVGIALDDLRTVYPDAPSKATHSVVVREKRATFSCTPAFDKLRPSHHTPISNLFLAGDWTSTGLPATIESAVLSGENCARLVASQLNNSVANSR